MYGQIWPDGPVGLAARNRDTGELLARRVGIAASRLGRAVGLLPRRGLDPGEGLWISPSRGVHTFWMRFTIDIVALDSHGRVVDTVESLRPWRVRLPRRGGSTVLELPVGQLRASRTKVGHTIGFEVIGHAG